MTPTRTGPRALAATAALLGVLAAAVGEPAPPRRAGAVDVAALAGEIAREADHVTAAELAASIRARAPGLRVLDVRSSEEYADFHIPTAEHLPLDAVASLVPRDGETLVLYSGGGAHAAQAWVLLRAAGHARVRFLSGGLLEWTEDVLRPTLDPAAPDTALAALSRYFGGTPRLAEPGDAATTGAVPRVAPHPELRTAGEIARLRRRGC